MGCRFSKPDGAIFPSSVDEIGAVRRDQETCRLVAELRSLGVVASGPPPAFILDESSLHPVSLAVASTPELKEAISKNPGLHSFVNDHLNKVIITTLRSLTDVKGHVDKAQVILSAVCTALECFERENAKRRNDKKKSSNKNSEAVDKLKKSRAVGDPFAGLNTGELRAACEWQRPLLDALRRRNHELEKRLRSVKKWRKVWNVIYMSGIVAVLACSVILAVVSPAAVVGATACATAMKVVEPWINLLWDRRVGSLLGEKDVIAAVQKEGEIAAHGLENVSSTVEKLKIDIDAMLEGVDFAISGEEELVKIGIGSIMAKKGEVEKGIDSLKELDGKIKKATTEFLKIMMKDIWVKT